MKHAFFVVTLALLASLSVSSWAQAAQIAPVNPEFSAWQSNKSAGGERFGYVPSPIDWASRQAPSGKAAPPASFDLRTQNPAALTSVKNQGSCGACWAFDACSAAESWAQWKLPQTLDLSENNMKNNHGFLLLPCDGGNNDMATAYLSRGAGPFLEADDPYNAGTVTNPAAGAKPASYVKSMPVFTLGANDNRSEIQNAIMTHGALAARMMWNDNAYNSGTNTYYYHVSSPATDSGHAIAVVGWDNAKSVSNAPGLGAWICKNSWGPGWGEGGFFYISYYDTVAVREVRAYINQVPAGTYSRVYQHDPLGVTGSAGTGDTYDFWGANVFTAAADGRITGVGTWADDYNTAYQVIVYKSGYNNGFSSQAANVSGTTAQPGYFVVDLPTPVDITSGQKFSIAVRYSTPGDVSPLPLEMPYTGYANATATAGQSYMSDNGSNWQDIPAQGGTWANANACIKALVQEGPYPVELKVYGPGLVQVGSTLNFRVVAKNLVGTATYQWRKNHLDIDGATEAAFAIPFANTYDTGTYTVVVTDGSKAPYESAPFHVEVHPAGSLPVAGMAGLAALVAALATLGAKRRRG
jgi:C1A family cysteine protease